jgi:hypothetical protein
MEKVIVVSRSFADADRAEKAFYKGLSPHERLEILLELNRRWPVTDDAEAAQGSARVCRVVKFS